MGQFKPKPRGAKPIIGERPNDGDPLRHDRVPVVREWAEPDGARCLQVLRKSKSQEMRSIVVWRRKLDDYGKLVLSPERHSHVCDGVDTRGEVKEIWEKLAAEAGVKIPSTQDPITRISMSGTSRTHQ